MNSNSQLEIDLSNLSRGYYFNIGEDFSQKLLNRFFELLNSIGPADRVSIFISSCGGDVTALFSLLGIINSMPARFEIIVSGICDSASLNMVLMSECEKQFLPSFVGGVLHTIGMQTHTRDLEDKEGYDSQRYKAYTKLSNDILKFYNKLGVPQADIDKCKQGKDVFLNRDIVIKASNFRMKNNIKYKL